jgi:hypothetical protein
MFYSSNNVEIHSILTDSYLKRVLGTEAAVSSFFGCYWSWRLLLRIASLNCTEFGCVLLMWHHSQCLWASQWDTMIRSASIFGAVATPVHCGSDATES